MLIEYVMLAGVNDSEETAHTLGKLLQGRDLVVNLIPFNATDVVPMYKAPSPQAVHKFGDILRTQYNLFTTVQPLLIVVVVAVLSIVCWLLIVLIGCVADAQGDGPGHIRSVRSAGDRRRKTTGWSRGDGMQRRQWRSRGQSAERGY